MSILKKFELDVIKLLAKDICPKLELERFSIEGVWTDLDFTDGGYFLTLNHHSLPIERMTPADPYVSGRAGEVLTGFIVFLGNNELTFECHSYGDDAIPTNYRELDVEVFI